MDAISEIDSIPFDVDAETKLIAGYEASFSRVHPAFLDAGYVAPGDEPCGGAAVKLTNEQLYLAKTGQDGRSVVPMDTSDDSEFDYLSSPRCNVLYVGEGMSIYIVIDRLKLGHLYQKQLSIDCKQYFYTYKFKFNS